MAVISFTLDIARFFVTARLSCYLYAYVTTCKLNKANVLNVLTFMWFVCVVYAGAFFA